MTRDIPQTFWRSPLLPGVELACVALGALVPCLLGYTVIRHKGRRLLFAAMALIAGVLVSALSAGLSYGPIHAWAWISAPVELGLLAAVFAAALTALLPGRVCVVLLVAVLIAQLVMLNAAPESAYFSLTLQQWEQGRFIHFNGLAQWVGWLWPYVALLYLGGRVGRPDGGQPEAAAQRISPIVPRRGPQVRHPFVLANLAMPGAWTGMEMAWRVSEGWRVSGSLCGRTPPAPRPVPARRRAPPHVA